MLEAFEILGYKTACHGFKTWMLSRDNAMWEEGVEIKWPGSTRSQEVRDKVKGAAPFGRVEFDQLLGEYEVVSDIPSVGFAPELIAAYPEAKVIIVEREVESWFESFQIAWSPYKDLFQRAIVKKFDPSMKHALDLYRAMTVGWMRAPNQKTMLANERDVYKQHYAEIRKVTPPERLLDFKLADGWEPLCAFLGHAVPDVPFPRSNDRQEYARKSEIIGWLTYQKLRANIFASKEKMLAPQPVR